MSNIAFLGLGAMGNRMAARLIAAGHTVTVWNRSAAKTTPFAERGVSVADNPRAAAKGAEIVIAMLRDDEASRQTWLDPQAGALAGLGESAIAIECSTLSIPYVRELAQAVAAADRSFIEAPLAGTRPHAEAGTLVFFAGGSTTDIDIARTVLGDMGSAVHNAGEVGAGAAVKLMVNALLGAQLAQMGELIAFAEKSGVDPATAVEIVGQTVVSSESARSGAQAMLAGRFTPMFPIELVSKDFGLIRTSADHAGATLPLSDAVGAIYGRGVEAGIGDSNIAGIVSLYR